MLFIPAKRVRAGNLSIATGVREDDVTRAGKAFIAALRAAGGNATGQRVPHGSRASYLVRITRLPTDRVIEKRARQAAATRPGVYVDRGQSLGGSVSQGNCYRFYKVGGGGGGFGSGLAGSTHGGARR